MPNPYTEPALAEEETMEPDDDFNRVNLDAVSIDILGVVSAHTAILRGRFWAGRDVEECVLYMPRAMFHQMLDEVLDNKAEYYHYTRKEFAGVGTISCRVQQRPDDVKLRVDAIPHHAPERCEGMGESFGIEYLWFRARAFDVTGFSVDMEHG